MSQAGFLLYFPPCRFTAGLKRRTVLVNRRGISLFILMGALAVISILAFASHFFARESLQKFRRVTESYQSQLLARSAVACVISRIQDGLQDPKSEIYKTLLAESLAPGTALNIDLSPLDKLVQDTKGGKVSVRATVAAISPLDPDNLGPQTGGADSAERRCDLVIEANSQAGPAQTALKEIREFRVVHLMPGILGKFTFFLKTAPADSQAFNRYANNINGWSDERVSPTDRYQPIVLKNGGELDEGVAEKDDPESYKNRGYIFMGGGPVVLNLTCGNDEMFGEFFHFFRMGSTSNIPGYYDPTPPPFFTKPPDFTTRHAQNLNQGGSFAPDFAYCLKHVVQGFFTVDGNEQNMNFENRLGVDLPGPSTGVNLKMRSSMLHLFGTRSNPSPTLVLGDVRRRYADYTGVVVEATGNNVRDAIFTYLAQTTGTMMGLPPLPTSVPAADASDLPKGTPVQMDPSLTYPGMFGTDAVYSSKMCRLVEEPYLRSFDYLCFRNESSFLPEKSLFGTNGQASIQHSFTLNFHPSLNRKQPFYQDGSLEALPDDFLLAKAVYRVPDWNSFLRHFQKDGKIVLDSVVSIIGSPSSTLEIPGNLVFEKAGMLILENGSLRFSGVKLGADPDQIPVLVALKGNIELDSSNPSGLKAILIALNGSVSQISAGRSLNLQGGLMVGNFPPDSFRSGGKIAYDSMADPSGPLWGIFYRGFVSDFTSKVFWN